MTNDQFSKVFLIDLPTEDFEVYEGQGKAAIPISQVAGNEKRMTPHTFKTTKKAAEK